MSLFSSSRKSLPNDVFWVSAQGGGNDGTPAGKRVDSVSDTSSAQTCLRKGAAGLPKFAEVVYTSPTKTARFDR